MSEFFFFLRSEGNSWHLVVFFHVFFGLLSLSHTNIHNISFHICLHRFWKKLNLHKCMFKDGWNGPFVRIHSHHPFGQGTDCNWRCSDETLGGCSCSWDGPWSSEVNDPMEDIGHISKKKCNINSWGQWIEPSPLTVDSTVKTASAEEPSVALWAAATPQDWEPVLLILSQELSSYLSWIRGWIWICQMMSNVICNWFIL